MKNLIEVVIDVPIFNLKESDLEKVLQQMSFLLHDTHLIFDLMRAQLNTGQLWFQNLLYHSKRIKHGELKTKYKN